MENNDFKIKNFIFKDLEGDFIEIVYDERKPEHYEIIFHTDCMIYTHKRYPEYVSAENIQYVRDDEFFMNREDLDPVVIRSISNMIESHLNNSLIREYDNYLETFITFVEDYIYKEDEEKNG